MQYQCSYHIEYLFNFLFLFHWKVFQINKILKVSNFDIKILIPKYVLSFQFTYMKFIYIRRLLAGVKVTLIQHVLRVNSTKINFLSINDNEFELYRGQNYIARGKILASFSSSCNIEAKFHRFRDQLKSFSLFLPTMLAIND